MIPGIRLSFSRCVSYATPIVNTTRRSYMRPKLCTRDLSRSVFDTMSCSPLRLRRRVLLTPICSTRPVSWPMPSTSPTANGLSNAMEREARRSPSTVCTASATAMPPTPRPVTSAVMFTPRLSRATSSTSVQIVSLTTKWTTVSEVAWLEVRRGDPTPIDEVAGDGCEPDADLNPHDNRDQIPQNLIETRRQRQHQLSSPYCRAPQEQSTGVLRQQRGEIEKPVRFGIGFALAQGADVALEDRQHSESRYEGQQSHAPAQY